MKDVVFHYWVKLLEAGKVIAFWFCFSFFFLFWEDFNIHGRNLLVFTAGL